MTLYLLNEWKKRPGGAQDASSFLVGLDNEHLPAREKELVIEALDDWEVITPTWFELAEHLGVIESLYEDINFKQRERFTFLCSGMWKFRAALVASKVSYCLGDYNAALQYALAAAAHFQLTPRGRSLNVGKQDEQFVNKMIEVALDTYKRQRQKEEKIDPRLEALVNRIFDDSLKGGREGGQLRHVVGLALDTRRADVIERAIANSEDAPTLLSETVWRVLDGELGSNFRTEVLSLLLRLFGQLAKPDFASMVQCLIKLDQPVETADILRRLVEGEDELLAYQIAFDVYENAAQHFTTKLLATISNKPEQSTSPASPTAMDTASVPLVSPGTPVPDAATVAAAAAASTSGIPTPAPAPTPAPELSPKEKAIQRLRDILSGAETIKHTMQFLIKNNHTDMLILRDMREAVRTASAHNATLIANGVMHLGTTCDDFLRDNLEWISKATNWNKFNAVATLGLIHKGHEGQALKLLEPYLPKVEADQFGFKEGGSLYAYGLMHANHGNSKVTNYLKEQLHSAQTPAVRHGASLGLGLAALGTGDDSLYVPLRDALYMDDAVSGEAAGIAMGLVHVGSLKEQAFTEMVQYVCDTQHDKIQRGLRTGIALLAYGRRDEAEPWIKTLLEHKTNAVLRQTAVCMLAMAYAGSGDPQVVRRLLARVASDPNNDVKRFAVMAIGFILSNDPEQCLLYVGMLVEHFNAHVRYGAAMALGIACAGSGYKEAIALLEPMLSAKENFVRQGAVVALALVYIQQNEASCPRVVDFRKTLTRMLTEKGEDSMSKLGAALAQGIIDAGGRNLTVTLRTRDGQPDMGGVIGLFVALQYWYWHSLIHFISLAFKPTCLIALNKNLEMPKMEFRSNAKASMFAYPPPLEETKKEEHEKVETAVLSITHKKRLQKKKKEEKKEESPAVASSSSAQKKADGAPATPSSTPAPSTPVPVKEEEKMDVDSTSQDAPTKTDKEKDKKAKKEPEPNFHDITNPARAVRLQLKTLSLVEGSRYEPVKPLVKGGIILVRDTRPQEKEEIVPLVSGGGGTGGDGTTASTEPQPHSTFEISLKDY